MQIHNIWSITKVKALAANQNEPITFFCGGSRNFHKFIDLFDGVFILAVDRDTLIQRFSKRPKNEWGSSKSEQELVLRLHQTKEDIPKNGIIIYATAPLEQVVDQIIFHSTL